MWINESRILAANDFGEAHTNSSVFCQLKRQHGWDGVRQIREIR